MAAEPNGKLRLGTFRSVWAAPEVGASPALQFLTPKQRVELSPADAKRLGIAHGERVVVGSDGHSVTGVATLRAAAQAAGLRPRAARSRAPAAARCAAWG